MMVAFFITLAECVSSLFEGLVEIDWVMGFVGLEADEFESIPSKVACVDFIPSTTFNIVALDEDSFAFTSSTFA